MCCVLCAGDVSLGTCLLSLPFPLLDTPLHHRPLLTNQIPLLLTPPLAFPVLMWSSPFCNSTREIGTPSLTLSSSPPHPSLPTLTLSSSPLTPLFPSSPSLLPPLTPLPHPMQWHHQSNLQLSPPTCPALQLEVVSTCTYSCA